jgi:hypothetical protein
LKEKQSTSRGFLERRSLAAGRTRGIILLREKSPPVQAIVTARRATVEIASTAWQLPIDLKLKTSWLDLAWTRRHGGAIIIEMRIHPRLHPTAGMVICANSLFVRETGDFASENARNATMDATTDVALITEEFH